MALPVPQEDSGGPRYADIGLSLPSTLSSGRLVSGGLTTLPWTLMPCGTSPPTHSSGIHLLRCRAKASGPRCAQVVLPGCARCEHTRLGEELGGCQGSVCWGLGTRLRSRRCGKESLSLAHPDAKGQLLGSHLPTILRV